MDWQTRNDIQEEARIYAKALSDQAEKDRRRRESGRGGGGEGIGIVGIVVIAVIAYAIGGGGSKKDAATSATPEPVVVSSQHAAPVSAPINSQPETAATAAPALSDSPPLTEQPPAATAPSMQDTAVQILSSVEPRYPPQAIRMRHTGTVRVEVRVAADGTIQGAAIQSSSGYRELDRAALEAVQHDRFKPATAHGMAVASTVSIPIQFKLTQM